MIELLPTQTTGKILAILKALTLHASIHSCSLCNGPFDVVFRSSKGPEKNIEWSRDFETNSELEVES